MTTVGIFLLVLWTGSHILILANVWSTGHCRAILVTISIMIMMAYLIKPYTYDLNKYSIFFDTGFIAFQPWQFPDDEFHLNAFDSTGEPFDQGFEPGFRWLAKLGSMILPKGSLVPRIDADFGDFKERGPPRSDAMIFSIMGLGFFLLLAGVRSFNVCNDGKSVCGSTSLLLIVPIIIGSIFFMLGSQNVLRQLLGLAIIILAMSSMASKRYFVSVILLALSSAFHQWAPALGLIGIYLVTLGSVGVTNHSTEEVKPFRLSRPEMLALMTGLMVVGLIKVIMVTGTFNFDIWLLDDLKTYVIEDGEYQILERSNSVIKASMIVGLVLLSEGLIGKTKGNGLTSGDIRSLRRRLIVFILPLAVYPEIFSRLLVLYWAVEMIFLVWALNFDESRVRLGGAVVFVAYGFAPNAINVLIGPNWLYNF